MWRRLKALILKDVIQFARDKTILGVVFWLYTIEVLICGYAMTFEVKDLPIAVIDHDRSVVSRNLIDKFTLSEAFEVSGYARNQEEAESWMRSGWVKYVMVIPNKFSEDYVAENPQVYRYYLTAPTQMPLPSQKTIPPLS